MSGKIVVASGYFATGPHMGHIKYLEAAKQLGDFLIVIVNNDSQIKLKGSTSPYDDFSRLGLVRALRAVDLAVLSVDKDRSVTETLRLVHELTGGVASFANGGDVNEENVREREVCRELNIKMFFCVGGQDKLDSSSKIIERIRMSHH